MAERLVFSFDYHPSVAEFAVSKRSYLAARPGASFSYIATSTLVLDTRIASNPRVLLLQRAASDEDPNKWEPPGGACDDDDESILHTAARELWEEAGLQASQIVGLVGDPHFFTLDDGRRVCQFNFAVQVATDNGTSLAVTLNPEEHQCFVWATEGEIKAKKADNIELDFTKGEVERTVLLVFNYFRRLQTITK
jgi:8-oxo-dGTP pyrophosphatase MutT (NUDIX family)